MKEAIRSWGIGGRGRLGATPAIAVLVAFSASAICAMLWASYGPEVFASMISSAMALCF